MDRKWLVAAGVVGALSLAAGSARADVTYTYDLADLFGNTAIGAGATFDGLNSNITGSFVYDASTGNVTSADITVSGSALTIDSKSINGTYNYYEIADSYLATEDSSGFILELDVSDSYSPLSGSSGTLGIPENIPLDGAMIVDVIVGGGSANASSIKGEFLASPSAVPEPASLALFGAALAGFGLIRRKRKA